MMPQRMSTRWLQQAGVKETYSYEGLFSKQKTLFAFIRNSYKIQKKIQMEEKGGYLEKLGVTAPLEHLGCFDGHKWMGSGEELRSIDPHTN